MTMLDQSQEYTPSEARKFAHDQDEEVRTTPAYKNYDAKISANLRCYLANHFYRQELARGVDPRKIVFLSIHCDAIFNARSARRHVLYPGRPIPAR